MHWRRKWQPTPVFLPRESQGRWSLMGCRLWGRTESDTTEATSLTSTSWGVLCFFKPVVWLFILLRTRKGFLCSCVSPGPGLTQGGFPVIESCIENIGTCLVVQWLRLHVPNTRGVGLMHGWETRSYMPQPRSGTTRYNTHTHTHTPTHTKVPSCL